MTADRATRALSFGAVASEYDATRPSYPDTLIEHLAGFPHAEVADVGAGTGKLTRLMLAAGWSATAIEPDPGMREVLAASAPSLTVLAGQGESLPIPDVSVDLVTYAQAWHWVDEPAAAAEAARVLRPGGVLALIWNTEDGQAAWVDAVSELTHSGARSQELEGMARPLSGFELLPTERFAWAEEITRVDLRRRAQTWSAVATLPDPEREALLVKLDELLDHHPETAGRDRLDKPHTTLLFAYRKT